MTTPTTISEVRAELERRADVTEEAQRLTKSAPMLTALVMRADALREAASLLSAAEAREGVLREAIALLDRTRVMPIPYPQWRADVTAFLDRKALGGTDGQH